MGSKEDLTLNEEPNSTANLDVGFEFITDIVFPSRDKLVEWARNVARRIGFVVTIQRADKIVARGKPRIMLGCDRGGLPRENQRNKGFVKKNLRKTSSKRCGCPFALQGQRDTCLDEWRLQVKCGIHTHGFVHLEAHAYAGRLDENEQKVVQEMIASGVRPRKILSVLKKRNPNNCSVMRTIYNEKVRLSMKELDGCTPIQFLYKCITEAGYISYNHVNDSTTSLEFLYFAHPTAVQLSNMFSEVFMLDCTYKTNRYRLPLLSIVGLTSTNLSFFSSFVFMSNETESSYTWALQRFKGILDENSIPGVFVIDREIALWNAIKVVFPQARIILCQVHINRNILAHCKKYFKAGKEFESFLCAWQNVVNSPTLLDFNDRFQSLQSTYEEKYVDVLQYVFTTWIGPYKESFISAWVDQYLHFGNCTTNRAESGHSQLKRFLEVSIGNLTSIWRTFDQMINLQHTRIKQSFGQSSIQVNTGYRGSLYTELLGSISVAALQVIKKEEELVKAGKNWTNCTHKVRLTMGLPCGHELIPYITNSTSFPLWMIHKHWQQLHLISNTEDTCKVKEENEEMHDIQVELDGILSKYNNSTAIQKNEMKRKLREIIDPTTSQTKEPLLPIRLKGRPRGSLNKMRNDFKSTRRDPSLFEHILMGEHQNVDPPSRKKYASRGKRFLESIRKEMPSHISKNIIDAIDMVGDGHCGYRAISHALNMGDNWVQVRQELTMEMKNNEALYSNIFGNGRRSDLMLSLDCNVIPAPLEKWMTMPDIGLVVASCYNIVLVHYSKYQSFTFLPLHSEPPVNRTLIYIGYVNDNHFIRLLMKDDSPLPPVFSPWLRYHEPIAEKWNLIKQSDYDVVNIADP